MVEQCTKLMVIRHAEKPDGNAGVFGVTEAGKTDENELTVRGWQRAGALVRFFNPSNPACLRSGITVPGAIFAARPTEAHPSKRSLSTVTPLAADLNLEIRADIALHQEVVLIAAAKDAAASVLICWHHERIPNLLVALGVATTDWPDEVFDRVLVLDRAKDGWSLSVMGQHLLPGDSYTNRLID